MVEVWGPIFYLTSSYFFVALPFGKFTRRTPPCIGCPVLSVFKSTFVHKLLTAVPVLLCCLLCECRPFGLFFPFFHFGKFFFCSFFFLWSQKSILTFKTPCHVDRLSCLFGRTLEEFSPLKVVPSSRLPHLSFPGHLRTYFPSPLFKISVNGDLGPPPALKLYSHHTLTFWPINCADVRQLFHSISPALSSFSLASVTLLQPKRPPPPPAFCSLYHFRPSLFSPVPLIKKHWHEVFVRVVG